MACLRKKLVWLELSGARGRVMEMRLERCLRMYSLEGVGWEVGGMDFKQLNSGSSHLFLSVLMYCQRTGQM